MFCVLKINLFYDKIMQNPLMNLYAVSTFHNMYIMWIKQPTPLPNLLYLLQITRIKFWQSKSSNSTNNQRETQYTKKRTNINYNIIFSYLYYSERRGEQREVYCPASYLLFFLQLSCHSISFREYYPGYLQFIDTKGWGCL